MYKRIKGKKFNRKTDQRKAFLRGLAINLVMEEKIKTTKVRARQVASFVERMITKAKKNNLASRKALASLLSPKAGKKLAESVAPRFKNRNGGYTRVIKIGPRVHDGAPMAMVELLDSPAQIQSDAVKKDVAKASKETKSSVKKNSVKKSVKEKETAKS